MLTILCIATYFKGDAYLRECRRLGCTVLLLTVDSLADAAWPRDAIDEIHTIRARRLRRGHPAPRRRDRAARTGSSASRRSTTSTSRPPPCCASTCRCPASGGPSRAGFATSWRCASGPARWAFACPNSRRCSTTRSCTTSPAAWRRPGCSSRDPPPRRSASRRSRTGTSCGARSRRPATSGRAASSNSSCRARCITSTRSCGTARVVFAVAFKYGRPPMEVSHQGGLFITRRLPDDSDEGRSLLEANRAAAGRAGAAARRVAHRVHPCGRRRRLRVSRDVRPRRRRLHRRHHRGGHRDQSLARVGEGRRRRRARRLCGAGRIAATTPASSCRWRGRRSRTCPRTTTPRSSRRSASTITPGVIVSSPDPQRIEALIGDYTQRFYRDFFATAPPPERPVE